MLPIWFCVTMLIVWVFFGVLDGRCSDSKWKNRRLQFVGRLTDRLFVVLLLACNGGSVFLFLSSVAPLVPKSERSGAYGGSVGLLVGTLFMNVCFTAYSLARSFADAESRRDVIDATKDI